MSGVFKMRLIAAGQNVAIFGIYIALEYCFF
jgi:hypothetical protein